MAGNSFVVDASEATRLAEDIARKTAALKAEIDVQIAKAAQKALTQARARAPQGKHTKKVPGSIRANVKKWASGAQFTLQTQGPNGKLGAILERGTSRSAPWLFLKAGMDESVPPLERGLMDAVSRIVDES